MLKEEIKCFKILCILAIITVCLALLFGYPFYIFIKYYPYNIVLIFLVLFVDCILSLYIIMKTHKNIKVVQHEH